MFPSFLRTLLGVHFLTYHVRFDNETGLYHAQSRAYPLAYGKGKSLYAAIDALERTIEQEDRANKINVNLIFEEKARDKIEMTAKLSIVV